MIDEHIRKKLDELAQGTNVIIIIMGKPPALPVDSQSLTDPEI